MVDKKDIDRKKNNNKDDLTPIQKDELNRLLKEKEKWHHFFQILKRKYIWIPLVLLIIYLKESQPLHIPIIDDVIRLLARVGGFH